MARKYCNIRRLHVAERNCRENRSATVGNQFETCSVHKKFNAPAIADNNSET